MKFQQTRTAVCEHCHKPFITGSNQAVRYCGMKHQRAANRNTNRSRVRKHHELEFIGVDGEGVGNGSAHRYVLLGCGERQYENRDGIQWSEALEFLWECYTLSPFASYVGFYLGYDFAQIFKSLPEERAQRLFTTAGIASRQRTSSGGNPTPFPIQVDDWEIDSLGQKRIKFRPQGESSWMYVCDAGPFFQSSLLKAIDPEGNPNPVISQAEFDAIQRGKAKRDSAELDDEMRYYNRLENVVLARLMTQLNRGFVASDVRLPRQNWYGPGAAVQAWFSTQPVPTSEEVNKHVKAQYLKAALASYFGGWFEIPMHGFVPGFCYEYDINSAYPFIMARLPCLLHGRWTESPGRMPEDGYTLVRATVKGSNPYLGTMNHRDEDGNILRPHLTGGWYWLHELRAAERAGLVDSIDVRKWINYSPCDCAPPMSGLAELYEFRKSIGKNSPQGKAAKLLYNSGYGKTAQSLGNPKYANPIYASLITAGCRTMILDAIATHPQGARAVAMVATDAVYFRTPHPGLSLGSSLGQWEESVKEDMTLFKPGVYWDNKTRDLIKNGDPVRFKSRGVNAQAFSVRLAEIDAEFKTWGPDTIPLLEPEYPENWPNVAFPVPFSMTTIGEALARGKWFTAGKVTENKEFHQSSMPYPKRHFVGSHWDIDVMRSGVRSREWSEGIHDEDSWPYKRGTMGIELDSLTVELSMSQDGQSVLEGYREAFDA